MLLTIDQVPVSEIGPWALHEATTDLQGPESLEWTMRPGPPHPLLKPGKLVELRDGPTVVWSGVSNRPARATGVVTATGHSAKAYKVPALDGTGTVTMAADTAIDAAIARGALSWKRPDSISSTAVSSDVLGEVPTIGDLLDAVADAAGQWWRVGANRVVELYSQPTTPTWLVTAEAGTLDVVEGDYASVLLGRRRTSSGGYATETIEDTDATDFTGYAEDTVDLTPLGYLTSAKAQAILTGMLAKGRARLQFANAVAGSRWQIQTLGSIPAHLPAVRAGQLARFIVQHDQTRYLQGRGYLDVLIGRVIRQGSEPATIELQPNNLVRGADWRDAIAYMATSRRK